MPKITISYRRHDSAAFTGRVYDRLLAHYKDNPVSMDATDIPTGIDFRVHIEEAIQQSDVLLVIIGHNWLEKGEHGRSRIHDPDDPIRAEIAAALKKGMIVIPVLIEGAQMPAGSALPEDVQALSDIHPAKIDSGRDFSNQFSRLLRAIEGRRVEERLGTDAAEVGAPIPAAPTAADHGNSEPNTFLIGTRRKPLYAGPSAAAPNPYERHTPEYWLQRVAVQRKLPAGDEPLVLISYASEDQHWISDLRAFLDRRLEQLSDRDGRRYQLWNFADSKRGTSLGDEFPEIVAEKMWRCRLAIVVLSKDYFNSAYCRTIELPFLMWRRGHHGLMCVPVKLGAVPIDMIHVPGYEHPASRLRLDEIVDDRQAPRDFANSPHRELTMKQLKERGLESEIENRFDGLSRRVFDYLIARYQSIESG